MYVVVPAGMGGFKVRTEDGKGNVGAYEPGVFPTVAEAQAHIMDLTNPKVQTAAEKKAAEKAEADAQAKLDKEATEKAEADAALAAEAEKKAAEEAAALEAAAKAGKK